MVKEIATLQYITQFSAKYSAAEQALLMFRNKVRWVQIRMKGSLPEEILEESKKALEYAKKYNAVLIINDAVEIAKEIGAHGVHLGLNDMPVDEARRYLGNNFIIGGTANTIEDIGLQASKGADYIGLGPFKHTSTKQKLSPLLGLEGYIRLLELAKEQTITIPVIAVGGVSLGDVMQLTAIGLHGVAISSALLEKYGQ